MYELLSGHLQAYGLNPTTSGDRLRLGLRDIQFRLELERAAPDALSRRAWLEVFNVDRRPMRFDISGWGMSDVDQAMDLCHGVATSIVPPVAWVVGASVENGGDRVDGPAGWELFLGKPWVIAAGAVEPVNNLAEAIRSSSTAHPTAMAKRLDRVIEPLAAVPALHWVKVYIASIEGAFDGRIDVDNESSWPGEGLARVFEWPSPTAIQLYRQWLFMRPVGYVPPAVPGAPAGTGSRMARLFGIRR